MAYYLVMISKWGISEGGGSLVCLWDFICPWPLPHSLLSCYLVVEQISSMPFTMMLCLTLDTEEGSPWTMNWDPWNHDPQMNFPSSKLFLSGIFFTVTNADWLSVVSVSWEWSRLLPFTYTSIFLQKQPLFPSYFS